MNNGGLMDSRPSPIACDCYLLLLLLLLPLLCTTILRRVLVPKKKGGEKSTRRRRAKTGPRSICGQFDRCKRMIMKALNVQQICLIQFLIWTLREKTPGGWNPSGSCLLAGQMSVFFFRLFSRTQVPFAALLSLLLSLLLYQYSAHVARKVSQHNTKNRHQTY